MTIPNDPNTPPNKVGRRLPSGIYVDGPPPPHTSPAKTLDFEPSLLPTTRPSLTDETALALMQASPESKERLHIAVAATRDATLAAAKALNDLSNKLTADLPRIKSGDLDQTFEERLVQYWFAVMALTDQMHTASHDLAGMVRIVPEWQLTRNNRDFCQQCQAAGNAPSLLDKATGDCPVYHPSTKATRV